jgi:hypothetical protein
VPAESGETAQKAASPPQTAPNNDTVRGNVARFKSAFMWDGEPLAAHNVERPMEKRE